MCRILAYLYAVVLAILIPSLAFPANMYWKSSLSELNAVSASNGDRGIVIADNGATTIYYRSGGAWVAGTYAGVTDINYTGDAPWYDASAFSSLSSASDNAVAVGKELWVTTALTVSADTTVAAPVRVLKGGSFAISSGMILTFTGPFDAGQFLVFSGAGSVKFSSPTSISPISSIKSAWWGD